MLQTGLVRFCVFLVWPVGLSPQQCCPCKGVLISQLLTCWTARWMLDRSCPTTIH